MHICQQIIKPDELCMIVKTIGLDVKPKTYRVTMIMEMTTMILILTMIENVDELMTTLDITVVTSCSSY